MDNDVSRFTFHVSRLPAFLACFLSACFLLGPLPCSADSPGLAAAHRTAPYDVVWTTPSRDAAGSMPLGNGEVGINLWVEENGDLLFYISRSDSLSEVSRLLKVGCVRVALSPNPFAAGVPFRQELRLCDGVCEITAGQGRDKVSLRVFVDAAHPVVHCLGESASALSVKATAQCWRTEPHTVAKGDEEGSAWTLHGAPFDLVESADVFAPATPEAVAWYHRNEQSVAFESTLKVQSLESAAAQARDPLLHRTFGGWMTGPGFRAIEGHAIESTAPVRSFALRVAAPCAQYPAAAAWLDEARAIAARTFDGPAALRRTAAWWRAFWERSWVIVDGDSATAVPGEAHPLRTGHDSNAQNLSPVTRGYTLQRYVQACGGRGTYPIKFNGGIFTVEPKAMGKPFNADFRAWGDCYWWQNVRHMYHPMLAGGDFEMMEPLLGLYEAARPLCEARAALYHGAHGCYFPETMTVWGTYGNGDYGWNRAGHQPKAVQCPYWQYAWNQGPELVALMLDRWDYTQDEEFLKKRVLPMAVSVLQYFDTRFKKGPDEKILLDPTQAVETLWTGVTNDTPTVAGLNDLSKRLGRLPERLTTPAQREFFAHIKAACPAVPIEETESDGHKVRKIAPAERYDKHRSNCENPELYAIWPFRLFGLGKPGLDEARAAYAARVNHLDVGWGYDGNCAALLGLADEAARILKVKCANSHSAYRWPATWGPNFDWLPDQNHGGNLLETTQLMLLQADGQKLRLLPAWPRNWDVHFKLHAPGRTTVECVFRAGKVVKLDVRPAARLKDVVLP